MDLQQYKKMIQDQLLHDVRTQMAYEHNLAEGNYIKTPKKTKKVVKKRTPIKEEVEEEEVEGGGMHHHHHHHHHGHHHHPSFIKHLGKVGKTLGHVGL